MQAPPWQPPKLAPFTPAAAPARAASTANTGLSAVGPALLLRAPLWAPQDEESLPEHRAFLAWLMGGYEVAQRPARKDGSREDARLVVRGDWAAALGVLGCTSAQVHALAVKWSWEVRGREYWTTTRAIGEAAVQAHEESVLEFGALARELDRKWLELHILEVDKAIVESKRLAPPPGQEHDARFLPRLFDNRELIALRRADGALEVQRTRVGLLERVVSDSTKSEIDWAKLPPADLESYRLLREKAKAV